MAMLTVTLKVRKSSWSGCRWNAFERWDYIKLILAKNIRLRAKYD